MFGSEILDVAIGLIFVYLLLGLICSAVNEWIARMFALRSNMLKEGIKNLLEGENLEGKKYIDIFYNHPLIKSLRRESKNPSYIPNRSFALTLMDIFTSAKGTGPQIIESIKDELNKLPDTIDFKKSLLVLISNAENDIKKLQENIEEWFDSAMARVSGWYKRRTQTITFIVAVIVSVGLNVDTITIADHLYRDDSARKLAVTAAQQAVEEPLPGDSLSLSQRIESAQVELDKLQLPIGWNDTARIPQKAKDFVFKIFGWLLTAFALSLGAPFWFDILKKLVNLRSTGTSPEKVTEKKPEKPLELRISTEGGK